MVKFSREYEASIIPEWKAAFVDYKGLKKLVKRIKIARRDAATPLLAGREAAGAGGGGRSSDGGGSNSSSGSYGFSVLDPVRALAAHFALTPASPEGGDGNDDDSESLESDSGELMRATDKHEQEFLEKADEELEKVNKFYAAKEADMLARGDALIEQLRILADVKRILADHAAASRRGRARLARTASSPPSVNGSNSGRHLLYSPFVASPQSMSDGSVELQQARVAEGAAVAEEVMAALEGNGVSFVGGGLGKAKKDGSGKQLMGRAALLQLPATVRIDIPPTSPGPAALKVWEELVNVLRKDGADPAAAFVHRKKVQHAEKNIRDAFLALYRGLELLKKFSSLNVKAFTKILKKFVKVSEQQRKTDLFSEKVKRSPFSSSDKVLQLADEVESIFLRHFAGNDRKVAMKYLKPQQPRNTHMITFLVGLFTGTFVSLFIIYSVLAHVAGIFSSTGNTAYMEIVYHVFSMFALISLHVFLYGCNLFMWKSTRINHNFIFDFSSSTAMTHRDAFLVSASIMCTVVAALVINLFLRNAGATYANALPGALLLLSAGVLFCPFNIFYRSTRYCFMRVMRNIILSPFYKVLMADFFMADQLTSQIPLLRHLEFTGCYFMAGTFRTHEYGSCTSSSQYKNLAYVLSFLPYYWRAMQCLRRYLEEGHDLNQLANAGKYVSAMVAAAVRFKYAATPTPFWMWMVIISSTGATIYQLYWDFVMDWGFLDPKSKNFWLRDQLILKNKSVYYASMMLNLVLRLAWAESVMKLHLGMVESRLLDFSIASLEIIRRGHWNFYRLENEHLTNAGKFRAVKTVPLPFRELETD
ncbi:phosphate transporter PHO1-2-like [Miscanthus floridulus]|uniref:phosphate transporter PHO1-2-like n=1 Tax=Miscanthus floridulus TaxID=154761 RepID=UPI00345984DA